MSSQDSSPYNDASYDQRYHYSTAPNITQPNFMQFTSPNSIAGLKHKSSRATLPSQWLESPTPTIAENRSLSPPHTTSDFSSAGGSPPHSHLQPQSNDEEIIPTAIVIKNIPFTVKRETLLDIIASLSIPTPYAFNYHLDASGSFRGLAFANFRLPADADAVVAALNGFDVQGRKLRVEYKKVLQAGEKERIEREKAIRRMRSMQLEKERDRVPDQQQQQQQQWDDFGALNQAMASASLSPVNTTMSSLGIGMPMGTPSRSFSTGAIGHQSAQLAQLPSLNIQPPIATHVSPPPPSKSPQNELDLNDPSTLEIYSRILVFKEDRMRDELAFSRSLTPKQRRVVHLVAQKLGVYHYSVGEGEDRYAVVTRIDRENRHHTQTLTRSTSSYLSPISASPSRSPLPSPGSSVLRAKKSMPDLASLHQPPSRLHSRASNGNMREYATISSPPRRSNPSFQNLFSNSSGGPSGIPPVPTLPPMLDSPTTPSSANGSGVMRQPRGPGVGGFGRRASEMRSNASGLEARSHEPLEI
ncbi:hypothetical protein BOTBODRAFT_33751 [Botryobasidium botryosum FD-172 SS1]|uniref:RRM domain-containing protein n=1 Tax=Botryobasidium botryosum (strain FD-172 SS1) TaxID=930990 RepID=A0A067MNI1_BOTB1|nr:hypothetical protein BOTBODRAFT_33751 [Botryobasidium botryosum FD-172 SS1]